MEITQYPIDLQSLPDIWAAVCVGDAILEIQPGFPCGIHNNAGLGVIHLRPMNIDRQGRLDLSILKYVPPQNSLRIRRGEVLFNNTNSPELIGKTAYINSDTEFAFSNHMTRLSPPPELDAKFVAYQLHFLWMTGYFLHRCTHHVNQASIASGTLADTVPLIVAPQNEQRRIVAEIEKHFTRIDAATAALRRTQAGLKLYRAAVLKVACEGRLVPTEAEVAPSRRPSLRTCDRATEAYPLSASRPLGSRPVRQDARLQQGTARR
jgi:type I restriction enzyme S subunit